MSDADSNVGDDAGAATGNVARYGQGQITRVTLDALRSSRTVEEAANKLGIKCSALRTRCQKHKLGSPSTHLYAQTMPAGQRLRGNSTLENGAGGIDQRWVKTERDSDEPPRFEPVPPDFAVDRVASYLDGQGNVRGQWVTANQDKATKFDKFWAAAREAAAEFKGLYEPPASEPLPPADPALMTVYPLGDPHIGMLAWRNEVGKDFDLRIAQQDLFGTVDALVSRAPESRIGVLANLGDFFHAENDAQLTPRGGNKLDGDGRFGKVARVGFNVLRRCIERMLEKHTYVHVLNVRGNHDPTVSIMLNMLIEALYEREDRVRVLDNSNPFTYVPHGRTLLGFCHGDGPPLKELGGIMATDRAEEWGQALYRYWLTGHRHHKQVIELPGCLIEVFRTLAPADYWAWHKGYRSGQSLECITYDARFGEVQRATVDLGLTRLAPPAA
jgi:hypothetical protein